MTAYSAGLRVSEWVSLKGADIDSEELKLIETTNKAIFIYLGLL
jgi:site-specific recombinase XerD